MHEDKGFNWFVVVLSFVLFLGLIAPVADLDPNMNGSDLVRNVILSGTPHAPIVIDGDTNFNDTAFAEGWPGNGTAQNPYIIDGLDIDLGGTAVHGINITNTRANFTIQNCNITNAISPGYGVNLNNVFFGKIMNNIFDNNSVNIYIWNCHYLLVKNNTCPNSSFGISLREGSSYNSITDNNCSFNTNRGINLESSSNNNTVTNNTCNNNIYGIVLYLVSSNYVGNNTFSNNINDGIHVNNAQFNNFTHNQCRNNSRGFYLFGGASNNHITDNSCSNNSNGIDLRQVTFCYLDNNTFSYNVNYGIHVYKGHFNNFTNNQCRNNSIGILFNGGSNNHILWNNFLLNVDNNAIDSGLNNLFDYNYWSNYTGTDSNGDDIGDTPHIFPNNQDSHPLIYPLETPNYWRPPFWTPLPANQYIFIDVPFRYDLNASPYLSIDKWWLEDIDEFEIDQNGVVTNATTLDPGIHTVHVFVNDTSNYILEGEFSVTIPVDNPIEILNDTDFAAKALEHGWIGDGSAGSPFVINGLEINRGGFSGHCISISNTRSNFTISNCNLTNAMVNPWSGIYLINVTYGELAGNSFNNNYLGIRLTDSHYVLIVNNTCLNNTYGIYLGGGSNNNTLLNNTCNFNYYGGGFSESSYNTLVNSTYNDNIGNGIYLVTNSYYNIVDNNTCANNEAGIYLGARDSKANLNTIRNNLCTGNIIGISLYEDADLNIISNNTCTGNSYGIRVLGNWRYGMFGSYIYYLPQNNDFLWNVIADNSINGYEYLGGGNLFDYNYWSDYIGDDIDGNGVGDSSYLFSGNQDQHPLMALPNSPLMWLQSPSNQVILIEDPFNYDLNASVYGGLDKWWIDDTVNFAISQFGVVTNNTFLPIDDYDLTVYVNDTLGNVLSGTFTLTVSDTISPHWIELPTNQVLEFGSGFYYNLNASDYSGLDTWWINDTIHFAIDTSGIVINITSLPVGTYGLHVWVNDTFGNILDTIFNVIVVDTTGPTWITGPLDQELEEGAPYSYSLDVNDLSGIHTWWVNDTDHFVVDEFGVISNITWLADGVYSCEVWVNDTSGNTLSGIFTLTVYAASPPEWIIPPVTQVVEFGDGLIYDLDATDFSGIDSWWLNDTTYFIINQDGTITNSTPLVVWTYSLLVSVSDTLGNILSSEITITVEDTTKPSWIAPPINQELEEGSSYLCPLDVYDLSEIHMWWVNDTAHFVIDEFGVVSNITPLSDGIYPCRVRVNDTSGNTVTGVFTLTVHAASPPMWISDPIDQVVEYGDGLIYDLDVTDFSGIDSWWLNDTTYFTIDQDGTITNSTPLVVGTYSLLISVSDTLGYTQSSEITITVEDTTDPSWIQTPVDQIVEYGEHLSYDLNFTDLSEIGEWLVDDTTRFSIDWTGRIRSLEILDVGTYGLQIFISDIYDNTVIAGIVIEVVDTTPPEWLTSVIDQYLEYGESFEYQLSAYDLSGIDHWSLDDTTNFEIDTLGLITSIGLLDLGSHNVRVTVTDSYGNELTVVFTIHVSSETTTSTTTTSTTTSTITEGFDPVMTLVLGAGIVGAAVVVIVIVFLRRKS